MKSLFYYYKAIKVNSKYIYHNIAHQFIYRRFCQNVHILSSEETIDRIIKHELSVARYGDGEFELIFGKSLRFQPYSKEIADRLEEVLLSTDEDLLVCINQEMFSKLKGSLSITLAYRRMLVQNRDFFYNKFNKDKIYGEASFTRFYINKNKDKDKLEKYVSSLKQLWDNKDILIVEGELSRLGVSNDLFMNTNSIQRILCPAINAFESYNKILESIRHHAKDKLVVSALGPTATILSYDLNRSGIRSIDIGHVDVEYMWFKLGAKKRIPLKGKYVNEAGSNFFETEFSDEELREYKEQIVCVINN